MKLGHVIIMVCITVIVLFFTREVVKEGHMLYVAFILVILFLHVTFLNNEN